MHLQGAIRQGAGCRVMALGRPRLGRHGQGAVGQAGEEGDK